MCVLFQDVKLGKTIKMLIVNQKDTFILSADALSSKIEEEDPAKHIETEALSMRPQVYQQA